MAALSEERDLDNFVIKEHDLDNFKAEFKYYKRRDPPPDLGNVIDFNEAGKVTLPKFSKVNRLSLEEEDARKEGCSCSSSLLGLKPVQHWNAFTHKDLPGLIFITNPFLPGFQRYWVSQCLTIYPNKPNLTNLDNRGNASASESIWEKSVEQRKTKESSFNKTLVHKLRWVTLGYHHDWNTKEYSSDKYTEFPKDLSLLSQKIAHYLGYENYRAEAAIVNFYHLNSTLGGHTDHSEPNCEAPLFSLSFGRTAVFLLGGKTKAIRPVAMYIRSGDIVVMSGAARLSYHAVPKILPLSQMECDRTDFNLDLNNMPDLDPVGLCDSCTELSALNERILESLQSIRWEDFNIYLQTSRININVRQVLKPGQKSLRDSDCDSDCGTEEHPTSAKQRKISNQTE